VKVVVYVRVSTGKQVEEGLGLVDQEHTCRAWARQHGHQVLAVFRDEGVSGTKELEHRLGLAEALAAVKDGRAGAIVVYRLDRLARDLVLQEQLLAEVWRSGELFSTAGGEAKLHDDPEDPSRRLIRQVLGAVSEYERAMIALRLRRGRAAKAARGGFAYGSPAFGHRAAGRPWSRMSGSRRRSPGPASCRSPAPRCARSGRPWRLRATGPSGGLAGIRRPWPGCSGVSADRSEVQLVN
jgi:DNA invertase Pin-like site-specific DNA recombinase